MGCSCSRVGHQFCSHRYYRITLFCQVHFPLKICYIEKQQDRQERNMTVPYIRNPKKTRHLQTTFEPTSNYHQEPEIYRVGRRTKGGGGGGFAYESSANSSGGGITSNAVIILIIVLCAASFFCIFCYCGRDATSRENDRDVRQTQNVA